MCEPHCSVAQIYNSEELRNRNNLLFGQSIGKLEWNKQVGEFLHATVMGGGHHNIYPKKLSLDKLSYFGDFRPTDFEIQWWDRVVKVDGYHNIPSALRQDSIDAVNKYANIVCIGSLHSLRQFLEISLQKTEKHSAYMHIFPRILNSKGKKAFEERKKYLPNKGEIHYSYISRLDLRNPSYKTYLVNLKKENQKILQSLILTCLGFTRRRQLLVSEWADDSALWEKSKK